MKEWLKRISRWTSHGKKSREMPTVNHYLTHIRNILLNHSHAHLKAKKKLKIDAIEMKKPDWIFYRIFSHIIFFIFISQYFPSKNIFLWLHLFVLIFVVVKTVYVYITMTFQKHQTLLNHFILLTVSNNFYSGFKIFSLI